MVDQQGIDEIVYKEETPTFEKIVCTAGAVVEYSFYTLAAIVGPVAGLLPPRMQMKLTRDDEKTAHYMSLSSRVFNAAWGLYGTASLVARAFGADIDPTPGNIVTWSGPVALVDSAVRETLFGIKCYLNNPFNPRYEPWGEPIWSIIDQSRNPEWYKGDQQTKKG